MAKVQTKVTITSAQRDIAISPLRRLFILIARDVLAYEGSPPTRLHISFFSDSKTRDLHNKFFNDPSPTDCMTFPIDDIEDAALPDGFLGEIVICPRTAIFESLKQKNTPLYELKLYLVHALLHLVGYRDEKSLDRKKMKAREKMHMLRLEKKGLSH